MLRTFEYGASAWWELQPYLDYIEEAQKCGYLVRITVQYDHETTETSGRTFQLCVGAGYGGNVGERIKEVLASYDTVKELLGAIKLIADKPLRQVDWITEQGGRYE